MDDQWKQSIEQSLTALHIKVERSSQRIDSFLDAWETAQNGFRALEAIARFGKVFLWITGTITSFYCILHIIYRFLTQWSHRQ